MFSVAILAGCGSKSSPAPEMNEMKAYTDPATQLSFKYPATWLSGSEVGHSFVAYSSAGAKTEFLDLNNMETEDVPGARIQVVTVQIEEGKTIEDAMQNYRQFEASAYTAPQPFTIDNTPAMKQTISFDFKTTKLNGELYYVAKDSTMLNIITFDVVGDSYETLKPKFQEILKGMTLGVTPAAKSKKVRTDTVQAELPSSKFVASSGAGFSISIPENFHKSGNAFSGDRRGDCVLQVATINSKGQKLAKIAEGFEATFGKSTKTTIGGVEAYMFNNPKAPKDIDSKIYYAMNGTTCYQVVVSYYKGSANKGEDAKAYKAAFAKMLKSIKFTK